MWKGFYAFLEEMFSMNYLTILFWQAKILIHMKPTNSRSYILLFGEGFFCRANTSGCAHKVNWALH